MKFDALVVDECHRLRNYNTAQSKAVFKLGKHAKHRFALTGTITVKHPADCFGTLKFLYPNKYTSFWGWAGRYFREDKNYHSGNPEVGAPIPERQAELQQTVGLISTARKRSEVMPWLPKKAYKVINAHMPIKQRKYYDDMRDTFIAESDDSTVVLDAENIMTQMIRLRQLSIDPRLVGFKEKGCKTTLLEQILKDQEEKSPVIVMSMFTSYLELLKEDLTKAGYTVDMITGKMTAKKKQEAANKFQAGEVDVLLCNIISAGTGWTLDRGDTVIFIDNAWNPSDQQQAEDRVTPTTEDVEHGHNIIHISTIDSVDQRMFEILGQKKSLTDIINEGGREAVRQLLKA